MIEIIQTKMKTKYIQKQKKKFKKSDLFFIT